MAPPLRSTLIWSAAAATAGIVAWSTTSKTMGVWPSLAGNIALGLVAIGIVVFTLWEHRLGRSARPVVVLLLATLGLVAGQEAWKAGYIRGHDIRYHAWAVWSLWRCVLDGDWWPRWNPYLALGLPLLQFYAPLPYVLAWPAQALGAPPDRALASVLLITQVATAFSAYRSTRWLGGSRPAGLVAAVALCLLPYHLMDQNFRMALGEHVAFPILPALFAALWKLLRGEPGIAVAVLIAASALLILSHVLTAITVAIAAVPLAIVALWGRERRWATILGVVLAGSVAVRITAFWWLPMAAEARYTALDQIVPANRAMAGWAAEADEWVERTLWPRYGIRYERQVKADPGEHGMPLYVGCMWLALLGLALFRPKGDRPDPRPFAIAAGGALLLATWPFAWALDGTYLVSRIQFPWRLYSPMGGLLSLAAGLAVDRWSRQGDRPVLVAIAVVGMAADSQPLLGSAERMRGGDRPGLSYVHGGAVEVLDLPRDTFLRVEESAVPPGDYHHRVALSRLAFPEYMRPELRARYGKRRRVPEKEESEALGVSWRVGEDGGAAESFVPAPLATLEGQAVGLTILPERITVVLPEGHGGGRVRVLASWFPGWDVRVDGGPARAASQDADLLIADVAPATGQVEFSFSAWRPWDRAVGLLVTWFTVLELGLRAGLRWRRRASGPDSRELPPGEGRVGQSSC